MKLFIALLVYSLALFALAGCGGYGGGGYSGGGGNNSNGVAIITVSASNAGVAFQSPVTVKSGQMVEWYNVTGSAQGITWDSQVPGTSPAPPATVANFASGAYSQQVTMPTVTTQTTYNYHSTTQVPQVNGQIIVSP